jgi:hypothetical protein
VQTRSGSIWITAEAKGDAVGAALKEQVDRFVGPRPR